MRLKNNGTSFTIWINADETYKWARGWPCSSLSGRRVRASFDTNGLTDYTVNGRDHVDVDGQEFSALVADHAVKHLGPDHPCYFVAVGQFLVEEH